MKKQVFPHYKPKHVGLLLNLPPPVISSMANDIESFHSYRFPKSSLGSYQFRKQDIFLLHTYFIAWRETNNKITALYRIQTKIDELEATQHPAWFRHIQKKNLPILR